MGRLYHLTIIIFLFLPNFGRLEGVSSILDWGRSNIRALQLRGYKTMGVAKYEGFFVNLPVKIGKSPLK